MPLPIWFVKREHLGNPITEEQRAHLLRCVGQNTCNAVLRGEHYVPNIGILHALGAFDQLPEVGGPRGRVRGASLV